MEMRRTFISWWFFVYFTTVQLVSTSAQEPCPPSYPNTCKCFPKSKWIKCENLHGVTRFPRVFNNDTKWLTLENSKIENISKEDFKNLPELTELSIIKGSLKYIEEGTFQQLQKVRRIILSENLLETMSFPNGTFAKLTNLKTVTLNGNPITKLPDDMFKNTTLETLSMMNSQLNTRGLEDIGTGRLARSLKVLNLDASNLHRLTKEQFSGLPNLTDIGLIDCNLEYIHTDFLKGTKVTHVDLLKNPIVKIDADAMRGDQITDFSCRYCRLTDKKVFGKDSFFLQMRSLVRLDLGHNDIVHIPKDAFEGMTKLETLLLFFNNISSIIENPFVSLPALTSLGIQNNPFNCDCNLAWFHKYAVNNFDRYVIRDIVCNSPSKLSGKGFEELNDSQFVCNDTANSTAPVTNSLLLSLFGVPMVHVFAILLLM